MAWSRSSPRRLMLTAATVTPIRTMTAATTMVARRLALSPCR